MTATVEETDLGAMAPLRNATFRMLWFAWLGANISLWMNDVSAAWLMTTLTTDPALVALVQTASTLPMFLLGLPSGALADIVDRRRYFAGTQLWAATIALVLSALALAGALSAPLLLPMLLQPFGIHWMPAAAWQFVLAAPVQFWLGARFYRAGWKALRAGTGNMDLLVALGTSAAFGLSLVLWAQGDHHLYFESAAVVITLVLFGKWLESRAKKRTLAALDALRALWPQTATLLRDGREATVPLAELKVGDLLRVRPGERIPTDASIVEGASHLDESMLTGESLPVPRETGDKVTGGSINGEGLLTLQVRAVGAETQLARICGWWNRRRPRRRRSRRWWTASARCSCRWSWASRCSRCWAGG